MKSTQIQNKSVSLGSASLVAWIFIAVVAISFAIFPVNQTSADEGMMILKGRVTSVDSYDRTISVIGTEGPVMLGVPSTASIILCDRNMSFGNLAGGQSVTITYHEFDGNLVADTVDIAPITLACYNQ